MATVMKLLPLLFILSSGLVQSETCDTRLDVRIKGKSNAGPAEVCWSRKGAYQWQPICGYDLDGYDLDGYLWNYHWNEIEAGIVCRQLNFTDPSYQGSSN